MKNVAITFGGQSVEHEISLLSAINIIRAIDKNKYHITLIGIDKNERFLLFENEKCFLNADNPEKIKLDVSKGKHIAFTTGNGSNIIGLNNPKLKIKIDIVFLVVHGCQGEDGTLQGLLKLLDVPFVGAGVLGSAIAMDKELSKRLLKEAGIPIAKFLAYDGSQKDEINFDNVKKQLGLPIFVKPSNTGSSVGINKVENEVEFQNALEEAFEYDKKVIIEETIKGREIECSILGNGDPVASLPGEVIPKDKFYSYRAKYIDVDGAKLIAPVKLSDELIKKIQVISIKAFKVLECEGMGRVDGFLTADDYYINEINTIPGFTNISMYPKLWEKSGLSNQALITKLIGLALKRHEKEQALKTSYK